MVLMKEREEKKRIKKLNEEEREGNEFLMRENIVSE